MMQPQELQREQRFAARVQQLLSAAIDKAKGFADEHMESIRLMLVDAWEELRLKPTALSPKDLEQLSQEVHHFLARHDWSKETERQYQQMLLNPFFTLSTIRYIASAYLILLGIDGILMACSTIGRSC